MSTILTIFSLFSLFLLYFGVHGRIHDLTLEDDGRREISLSTFGFLQNGILDVNVTMFSFKKIAYEPYHDFNNIKLDGQFGFTLSKRDNTGGNSYLTNIEKTCTLKPEQMFGDDKDGKKKNTVNVILFTLDFTKSQLNVQRFGDAVKNLEISMMPEEPVREHHEAHKRSAPQLHEMFSDSYLYVPVHRRKRAADIPGKHDNNAVDSKPSVTGKDDKGLEEHTTDAAGDSITTETAKGGKGLDEHTTDASKTIDTGKGDGKGLGKHAIDAADSSKTIDTGKGDGKGLGKHAIDAADSSKTIDTSKEGDKGLDKQVNNTSDDSKKTVTTEPDTGKKEGTDSGQKIQQNLIPMIKKKKHTSFQFRVKINEDKEEGLYHLYFHNCLGASKDITNNQFGTEVSFSIEITENNNGNFLSAGNMPLPTLYFVFCCVFFVMGGVWLAVLRRARDDVYKIHFLMLTVVYLKSLSLLFHAVHFHFIEVKGRQAEAWAVLYYIAYLMKVTLLFLTILLIGAGWAFVKHLLSEKEKKLFIIFIPLQILANIAFIIVEESEEGMAVYTTWKEIFVLVDLLCCGAILFPVVWSIRHLTEASQTDGKAAINLSKLKLFRQFYILVVCYIYFTRIIVYLLQITVPFKYSWLDELFKQGAVGIFFVVTGVKFRPASDNPYLQVPQDSDDEIEMDEVLTKSGALTTVVKINRDSSDRETTTANKRESSHDYD